MDFEQYIVDIKKLTKAISKKESEVFITYKGYELGISKPWHIKCDTKEFYSESHLNAAQSLYNILIEELKRKISATEDQVFSYKESLTEIVNHPGLELKREISRRQETSLS
jgi:hypothetical protein